MLRFAWIFARLRWRLMVNAMRKSRRRDALERVSRFSAVILPALMLIAVLSSSALIAAAAGFGGWKLGAGTFAVAKTLVAVRIFVLVVAVLLVLFALGGASQSVVARSSRMLLLPVPRRALHLVELLANFGDPWVVCTAPALLTLAAGLLVAGRVQAAFVSVCAGAVLLCVLVSLTALVSFALSWLVRGRRRGELYTLTFVLLLSVVGLLPALTSGRREPRGAGAKPRVATVTINVSDEAAIERFDRELPVWTHALPSELYARSLAGVLTRDTRASWLAIGALSLEALLLFALSAFVHGKLLHANEGAGSNRRTLVSVRGARRLPGLTQAASAVARTQARTTLRSVRGRLIVLMPAAMIGIFGLIALRGPPELRSAKLFGGSGPLMFGAGVVFTLYAYLSFTMNQLASDRAGLTLQFLAPISERDLVRGKAVGHALVLAVAAGSCALVGCAVAPLGSPFTWASVALGGVATYLLMMPIASAFSAWFPVAADMSKTGSGGNAHNLSMIIGTLLVLLLSLPPALVVLYVDRSAQRPALALALIAGWTLVSAAVAIPLLDVTARVVQQRRENVGLVAQGR